MSEALTVRTSGPYHGDPEYGPPETFLEAIVRLLDEPARRADPVELVVVPPDPPLSMAGPSRVRPLPVAWSPVVRRYLRLSERVENALSPGDREVIEAIVERAAEKAGNPSPYGRVGIRQLDALHTMRGGEGWTASALADETGSGQPAMSRILDTLVDRGLVTFEPSPYPSRPRWRVEYHITADGIEAIAEAERRGRAPWRVKR